MPSPATRARCTSPSRTQEATLRYRRGLHVRVRRQWPVMLSRGVDPGDRNQPKPSLPRTRRPAASAVPPRVTVNSAAANHYGVTLVGSVCRGRQSAEHHGHRSTHSAIPPPATRKVHFSKSDTNAGASVPPGFIRLRRVTMASTSSQMGAILATVGATDSHSRGHGHQHHQRPRDRNGSLRRPRHIIR